MNKFYSMLGIAKKGGKIAAGYDVTCDLMKKTNKILVIIASDASDKTKKNVQYFCDKYQCKYIENGEKDLIGKSIGKKMVSVLAVKDENIINYLINNI